METRHENSNLLWGPCICGYETPGTVDSPAGTSMATNSAVDGLARPIIIVGGHWWCDSCHSILSFSSCAWAVLKVNIEGTASSLNNPYNYGYSKRL